MMIKKTFNWRSLLPYVVAILVFYAICIAFFNPLLEGKRLKQSDIVSHKGMAKDINDHREQFEEEPYWTDGMFSGMPSYLISVYYKSNIIKELNKVFKGFLPNPAGMVFLYLLGFYILLLSLRVDKWLSIVGAIAFAFSSYFFIILEPGHNTKALAIGYMAPLFAGIILTYRGKYWLGASMTALFLTLQIKANHPQITYYLLLLLLLYVFVVLADHIKNKMLPKFLKSTGILAVIALLAVATHAPTLLAMNEYLEVSTRGTSEIAIDKQKKTKGLDRDYATAWSYGKQESLSLLIPNIKGGSSSKAIGENESLLKAVNEPDMVQTIANTSAYFGNQPFTSGPVYIGAIVIFLFVLGMFILKGRLKWVLFAATVFSILLAWGKNMMWLTNLFLDYFPMYSKFRAVSMILVIAELCVPIVAFLGLKQIYQQPRIIFDKVKIFGREIQKIVLAFMLTGGIAFLFVIAPGIITLEKENEADNMRKSFVNYYQQEMSKQGQQADMAQINEAANQFVPQYMNELENVRKKIVRNDAFRSFIYILLAAALLFFTTRRKNFNPMFLTVFLGLLIIVDMWTVNKRYLDNDNFVRKSMIEKPFTPTEADKMIMNDDGHFRVLNLTVDVFNDASVSYFHNSIGGYSAVKMKRYQELFTYHRPYTRGGNYKILDMLNTKWIINAQEGQAPMAIPNENPLGNAWFVQDIKWVNNPDEEFIFIGDASVVTPIDENAIVKVGEKMINGDTVSNYIPISITTKQFADSAFDLALGNYPMPFNNEFIFGKKASDTAENYIRIGNPDVAPIIADYHFSAKTVYMFEPKTTAVIDKKWKSLFDDVTPLYDSTASIILVNHKLNHLTYKTNASHDQVAVFSEIFYDKGWKAYIDGAPVPHGRANWILRTMPVPAGEHIIEFKFDPKVMQYDKWGLVASFIIIIITLGGLYMAYRKRETAALEEDNS